jgi:steroid delta-isomerase-like uncharacterized protein
MPEQNKQTVRRLIDEFWNKQNFDVADQMFAPDAVYQTDGVTQSYAEVKAAFMQTRHAFPDMQVSIDDLLAEGDKVALRWTARGTHKNEFIGIAPTNRQVTMTGLTIYRFSDGRIVQAWNNSDSLGNVEAAWSCTITEDRQRFSTFKCLH